LDTLFGVMEPVKEETSLKIKGKTKQNLTKKQQLFNKYTTRIENLRIEIKNEESKLHKLLITYHKKVKPVKIEGAEAKLNLAKVLSDSTKSIKYTDLQYFDIGDAILELFDEAFEVVEPNESQIKLFNKWSDLSYTEILNIQEEYAKTTVEDMIRNATGIDIDINEISENPEKMKEFEDMINNLEEEFDNNQTNQKISKKQIENEQKQKLEKSLKERSIRNIYIGLAKVLHPDTELDLELKLQKEELMKKVTTAYNAKDLSSLLKLELEWVNKESDHLDKMTDEKLDIFLSFLKEQVKELDFEKKSICAHPRYFEIIDFAHLSETYALRKINDEVLENKSKVKYLLDFKNEYEKTHSKKLLLKFVNEILRPKNYRDFQNVMKMMDFGD